MATEEIFQPRQLKKAVAKKAAQSPLVLYPVVTGGLGMFTGALFGFTGLVWIAVGAALLFALGAFTTEFGIRRDRHAKQIILEATHRMEAKRSQIIEELKSELSDLNMPMAEEQVETFKRKFAIYQDVLDDRFSPTELTFARYLGVAEQVYLSGLDNIKNAVISKKALRSIDAENLKARIHALGEEAEERSLLESRLKGFENTSAEIKQLLLMNEKALAQLDEVTQRLALTRVEKGMADSDTESAIAELHRLGARLHDYAQHP